MDPRRFDRISKLFANRRLSRRQAIATGGAGLATLATGPIATAQDATPDAETVPGDAWSGEKTTYLFVQSFHGGSITPTDDIEGRYTVTLNQGTGQTISFGDRPSRDVGVTDTPEFLEGLGFSDDNPPNAALIVETESGETDIAVVELFNPTYDPETRGVTYEVEVLDAWQEDLDLGLREEPTDLATLAPAFGSAHLLIDDCPSILVVECHDSRLLRQVGILSTDDVCWVDPVCVPCEPYGNYPPDRCAPWDYWSAQCEEQIPECSDGCDAVFANTLNWARC